MTTSANLLPDSRESAPKAFRHGTHRLVPPEETLARVHPFMTAMQITRVANITGLDCIGVPVAMVCRPNARSLAVSQGKGLTLAAAKASALMEEIESYHAERVALPLKRATYEDLRRDHRVVDVDGLPRAAQSVYHPDLAMLWVEGWDLMQQQHAWVPYEVVSLDFTLPSPGVNCFAANSNGLASGNHLLEAISHGVCEVIERDATTLWSLRDRAEQDRARVDPATVDDPGCQWVLAQFFRANVMVGIWDLTSDVGVPTFQCLIVERSDSLFRRLYAAGGNGCHPVREIALLRALTEAAQTRATVIAGARDDVFRADYERYRDPRVLCAAREMVAARGPMRSFRDAPTFEAATFEDDVGWELERLWAVGIRQAIAVDLTQRAFNLPVVKLVIPGLEGIVPELAPQHYVPGARARALLRSKTRLTFRLVPAGG